MSAPDMLEKIGESLRSRATVEAVFGEPIRAEGKTVVPIAKVAFAFGAGSGGAGMKRGPESDRQAEGGGGGGGVRARPAGALEITATKTRFIPFTDMRLLTAIFAGGALIGSLFARRRLKS